MTEREALERLVKAWEAIKPGHNSPGQTERWLRDHMWHAINDAREVLGVARTDR